MKNAPVPFRIQFAAEVLRRGGVVAYPTEAVWGIGCDPAQEKAVRRLLALKRRPARKGLILAAGGMNQFEELLAGLEPAQRARLERSWPGPVSWLVPHRGRVPPWICGEHASVALRVSAHPLVASLCDAFGGPIVSTSANVAGFPAALEAHQVQRYFGAGVDYFAPGHLGGSLRPSAIRDLVSGEVIRPG